MRKLNASKQIAVVYPASVSWMASCIDGIRGYADERGGWRLLLSPPTLSGAEEFALTLRALHGWKGDAIVAATNNPKELAYVRELGLPVVNLAGGLATSHGVPRVMVNHFSAGRMAAQHLLERGLRHLAFFGWKDCWYSDQRYRGFTMQAGKAGVKCQVLLRSARDEAALTWRERVAEVSQWLVSLPCPAGVFAVQDYRAQFLMEVCREIGLRIPDDIALIGMDNEVIVCEHLGPTLTSVSRNSEQMGREVAALLDRMMQGAPPPDGDTLLEPDGVVARESTDKIYNEDPVVQQALDLMRQRLVTPFNIEELAGRIGVSKRTLETRFRERLHDSPHGYLTKLRVKHARLLLESPEERGMEQLALDCGFGSPQALRKAFERITGQTLAAFRRRLKEEQAQEDGVA